MLLDWHLIPVSYTHLDVYKRQDLENNAGSMIVNIGAQSTNFSIVTGGRIIINKKIPIGGRQMNEADVSYTHLDVYKRQGLRFLP